MKILSSLFLALTLCSLAAQAKEVNIYNWEGYIGKDTIAHFEKETGIKVKYDPFDSYETAEAKLLSGNSGYDLVNMSSYYLARQGTAGVWTTLDKNKIPNWKNIDPDILKRVANFDPDNQYGQPQSWYTAGVAYNKAEMIKRFTKIPDSWAMVFEVDSMKKLSECGFSWTDAAGDLFVPGLVYLGLDPFSENRKDYDTVLAKALPIRPYVITFSNTYWNMLADADTCASISWSGDVASLQSKDLKAGVELGFFLPKEGSYIDYDVMGIPSDSANKKEAYDFLNFILKPEEAADFTNTVRYPNSVSGSQKFIDQKLLKSNIVFYPTPEQLKILHPYKLINKTVERYQNRLWTKFITKI